MLAQVAPTSPLATLAGSSAESPSAAGAAEGEFAGLLLAQVDAGPEHGSPPDATVGAPSRDFVPAGEPGSAPRARLAFEPLDLGPGRIGSETAVSRSSIAVVDRRLSAVAPPPAWAALRGTGVAVPSGALAGSEAGEPANPLFALEPDDGEDAPRDPSGADLLPLPIAAAAGWVPSVVQAASPSGNADPKPGSPGELRVAAPGDAALAAGAASLLARTDEERSTAPVPGSVPEASPTSQTPETAGAPAAAPAFAPEIGAPHPGDGPRPNVAPTPWQGRLEARPGSAEFAPAFGLQISTLARDGVQHARLHLNPVELGPIVVKIAIDGGNARIDFQADAAQTRSAIEASLPTLAGAMRDAGLTLAGGGVFQQPQDTPSWGGQPGGASGESAPGSRSSSPQHDPPHGEDGQPLGPLQAIALRRGLVDLVA